MSSRRHRAASRPGSSHLTLAAEPPRTAEQLADLNAEPAWFTPTAEHRAAAHCHLAGEPVASGLVAIIADVVDRLEAVDLEYIRMARAAGDEARVWETARRVLALKIAESVWRAQQRPAP